MSDLQVLVRRMRRQAMTTDRRTNVPDAELLQRFTNCGDNAAFELLVWRHGALVLSMCRRILGQSADAEDAFQATFLALLQQARHIRNGDVLAGWLYRVAHRIARRARTARMERLRREGRVPTGAVQAQDTIGCAEIAAVIDDEVTRLPERLRLPFVLSQLQGKPLDEVARELGIPRGTLLSRLARARERLRFRLTRRGITLGAGTLGTSALVSGNLSAALVFRTLTMVLSGSPAVTNPAVVALMEGVLNAMFWNKIKVAAGVLLVTTTVGAGTAWACHGPRFRARGCPEAEPVCIAVEAPAQVNVANAPVPPEPAQDRVKEILTAYQSRMRQIDSAWCPDIMRIERSKTGEDRTFKGEFRFLRPRYAALRLVNVKAPQLYELAVLDGSKLHIYQPSLRQRRIHALNDKIVTALLGKTDAVTGTKAVSTEGDEPQLTWLGRWTLGSIANSPPRLFLFGVDARTAQSRFEWNLMKEDASFLYLTIKPRSADDMRNFKQAQLVLRKDSFLPRRLWYLDAAECETTWEVPTCNTDLKLTPKDFTPPEPPATWTTKDLTEPPLPATQTKPRPPN